MAGSISANIGMLRLNTAGLFNINLNPPHDELSQAFMDRFDDMNIHKKGDDSRFIDKDEINAALGNPSFTGVHAAMVATIKKYYGDFEEFHDDEFLWEDDGITKEDMTEYDRLRLKDPNNAAIQKIQGMFNYAKQKIADTSKSPFPVTPDPLQTHQGMVGDCWFLAAMVGVAKRNPVEIVKMISGPLSSTFYVKFPGRKNTLMVSMPTDGEIAIFGSAGANGLWMTVLEKAYGTSMNQDAYFFVDKSPTDAADVASKLSPGIQLYTGHMDDTDELF